MTDNGHNESVFFRKTTVGGWSFLLLIAAGALLLLLGRNSLTGVEGDAAEGCRRLLELCDPLAPASWRPDSIRTWAYSRLLKPFILLPGGAEFVLRLPSVLFAMVMLIGTGVLTRELFGSARTSLFSGWLLLGAYGFLFWGRCAHATMLECCCILWGAVLLYREREMEPFLRALLCFLLLAALWIFSGAIGVFMLILIALPVIVGDWKTRRFEGRSILNAFIVAIPAGFVAAALLCRGSLPWSGWENEWQRALLCQKALWQDAVARCFDGHALQWWCFGTENLVRMILPWPLLAIIAAATFWRKREEITPQVKKLLLSTLLIFVLFGIFPVRRWQILLPLLPFLISFIAGGLTLNENGEKKDLPEFAENEEPFFFSGAKWMEMVGILMYWLCAFLGAVAVALPVTLPIWKPLFHLSPPLSIMFLVPLLGACALATLIFGGERDSWTEGLIGISGRCAAMVLACVWLSISLLTVTLPALTEFRTERNFFLKVRSRLRPYAKVIFVGRPPSSQALFYLAAQVEPAFAASGEELKEASRDVPLFLLIGRDDEQVREIIEQSGVSTDLQHPVEKENTPIRLRRTEDHRKVYCLWRRVVNQVDNGAIQTHKEKKE